MEKQLDTYLQEHAPALALRLSDIKCQYFGFLHNENRLIIPIGFCRPWGKEWVDGIVTLPEVDAGCYFEAQYNIGKQEYKCSRISGNDQVIIRV